MLQKKFLSVQIALSLIWISTKRYKCYSGSAQTELSCVQRSIKQVIMLIKRLISVLSGRSSKVKSLNFVIWWTDGQSKRPPRQDKHGHYFLYHIFCSFYNHFITTLKVAAELDIPILITLSNSNIILHDVLVQLQIFNSTNINHGQSYPIFGFW